MCRLASFTRYHTALLKKSSKSCCYGGPQLIGPNIVSKNGPIYRFLRIPQVLLTMAPRNMYVRIIYHTYFARELKRLLYRFACPFISLSVLLCLHVVVRIVYLFVSYLSDASPPGDDDIVFLFYTLRFFFFFSLFNAHGLLECVRTSLLSYSVR